MSKPSTLLGWIQLFERKSGQRFSLRKGYNLTVAPDGSFCQWKCFKGILFLAEVAGDHDIWQAYTDEICKLNKIIIIVTFVRRNPRVFARMFGSKILFKKRNKRGQEVFCIYKEVL